MTAEQMEDLLDRHGAMLWTLCRKLAGVNAEDLFQESLLRAQGLATISGGERGERNVLYTICLNLYRSDYAKRKRRAAVEGTLPSGYDPPSPANTQEEAVRLETRAAVQGAVNRLSDAYRLPVLLFYFSDWPTAQIAQALGEKESTIRSRLMRARKKLQAGLEEWL